MRHSASMSWPSTGLDNGLAPDKGQAIISTSAEPIHWRIQEALGGWISQGVVEKSSRPYATFFKSDRSFIRNHKYVIYI